MPDLRNIFEGISSLYLHFVRIYHFPRAGYTRHRCKDHRFIQPKLLVISTNYDMPRVFTFRQSTNNELLVCALRMALINPSPLDTARYGTD